MKDSTDLDNFVCCLHQLERPSLISIGLAGVGDCIVCKYDPDLNVKCKKYFPVVISFFEVMPNS